MDFSAKERDLTERERVSTDERERGRHREMDSKIYEILRRTRNVISLRNLLEKNELTFDWFLTDFVSHITALHIAIQHRSVDFAREILRRKPQLAYVLNSQGCSPLRMASANGSADIVGELLLLIGDVSNDRDSKGWTPVHAAAMKGHLDVLNVFNGTNPEWIRDITDRDETVLHLCVKYNKLGALIFLTLLVDRDNEFVNRKDENGNTILHLAAMKKDMEMITYLISTDETSVEINATNMNGFTALDVFALRPCNSEDEKIENELRKKGAKKSLKTSAEKADKENVLILVGTLTATLCFQAALVPPGGLWQDDSNMVFNNCTMGFNNSSDNKNHTAGTSILADKDPRMFISFQGLNYLLFSMSLLVIFIGAMSTIRGGSFRWKLFNPQCVTVMLMFGVASAMIYLCNQVNTPEGFAPEIGRGLYVTYSNILPAGPLFIFFSYTILFYQFSFYHLVCRVLEIIRGNNVDTGTKKRS